VNDGHVLQMIYIKWVSCDQNRCCQ